LNKLETDEKRVCCQVSSLNIFYYESTSLGKRISVKSDSHAHTLFIFCVFSVYIKFGMKTPVASELERQGRARKKKKKKKIFFNPSFKQKEMKKQ